MFIADRDFAVLVGQIRADLEFARLTGWAVDLVRVLGQETAEFHLVASQHMSDVWPVFSDRNLKHFVRLNFEHVLELVRSVQAKDLFVRRIGLCAEAAQRERLQVEERRVIFGLVAELVAF